MSDSDGAGKRTAGDVAHAVARAALGSIPVIGAAGAELFAYVVEQPYERRKQEWMRDVGDALAELRENRKVDIETLRENPSFTDIVLRSTQAALRTQDLDKRASLRNVIMNSALPDAPDEALQIMFIRFIDELTSLHVQILAFFRSPKQWFEQNGKTETQSYGTGADALELAFAELKGRHDVYDQLWRDLFLRGLVRHGQLHTGVMLPSAMSGYITPLGERLLDFIGAPVTRAG